MKTGAFILSIYIACLTILPAVQLFCTEIQTEMCCETECSETNENNCADNEKESETTGCCLEGICCSGCFIFVPLTSVFKFMLPETEIKTELMGNDNIASNYSSDSWKPPEFAI